MGSYKLPSTNLGLAEIADKAGDYSGYTTDYDLNDAVEPHYMHEMYGSFEDITCPATPNPVLSASSFRDAVRYTDEVIPWEDHLWFVTNPGENSFFPGPGIEYWGRSGTGPIVGLTNGTNQGGGTYCSGYPAGHGSGYPIQRIDALTKTAGVDIPRRGRVSVSMNSGYLDHEYYFMVTDNQEVGQRITGSCSEVDISARYDKSITGRNFYSRNNIADQQWHWLGVVHHHAGGRGTWSNSVRYVYTYDYDLSHGEKLYFAHTTNGFGAEAANMQVDITISPDIPHPIVACLGGSGGSGPLLTDGRKIAEGNIGGGVGTILVPDDHKDVAGTYLIKIYVNGGASCEVTYYRAHYSGTQPSEVPAGTSGWRTYHREAGCRGHSTEPCYHVVLGGRVNSDGSFHSTAIPNGWGSYLALMPRYGKIDQFEFNQDRSRGYGGKTNNWGGFKYWEMWKADLDLTEGSNSSWSGGLTNIADSFNNEPLLYKLIGKYSGCD